MQQSLLIGLGLFAAVLLEMPNALAARYKIVGQKLIAPGYWKVMVRYAWKNGPVDTDVYEVNCKTRNATYKGMNRLPMGDEESLINKVCNW